MFGMEDKNSQFIIKNEKRGGQFRVN